MELELALFAKVALAGLLGFLVGLEREFMGSAAGDRTFSLVAIGAALFTTLAFEVFGATSGNDPGRVAANILTGVAGIWAVSAVGMAVASERYSLAILSTVLIMVVFAAERVYSVKQRRST